MCESTKAAIFGDRADAVGVSVGRQAGVALLAHHVSCSMPMCGSIGSGLIPGKSGFTSCANRNVLHIRARRKIPRQNTASRAIHRIDGKLELRFRDQIHDRRNAQTASMYGFLKSTSSIAACAAFRHRAGGKFLFDLLHDGRRRRAAKLAFELHAIPVPRIVAGGDHHAAGRALMLDGIGNRGRRRVVVRQASPECPPPQSLRQPWAARCETRSACRTRRPLRASASSCFRT